MVVEAARARDDDVARLATFAGTQEADQIQFRAGVVLGGADPDVMLCDRESSSMNSTRDPSATSMLR